MAYAVSMQMINIYELFLIFLRTQNGLPEGVAIQILGIAIEIILYLTQTTYIILGNDLNKIINKKFIIIEKLI